MYDVKVSPRIFPLGLRSILELSLSVISVLTAVTPRDRALCEFQHSRPNPHNTRFQVVNWVVTLQQITIIHNNRKDIQHNSNESRIQLIQYKDPNNSGKNEIASDYGQDTNWTKSPGDNRWRPIPAQAKPEGFPS